MFLRSGRASSMLAVSEGACLVLMCGETCAYRQNEREHARSMGRRLCACEGKRAREFARGLGMSF